jgi:hypothetical protein
MSGETPATHLARLKDTYRAWSVVPAESGGWLALDRSGRVCEPLTAPDLPTLEGKLLFAESGRT